MHDNFSNILDLIITEADRRSFLQLVSELKEATYKTDGSIKEVLRQNIVFSEAISAYLPRSIAKIEDKTSFQAKLETLENLVKQIRSMSLTLAIPVTDRIINMLKAWGGKNFSEKTIFDITLDEHIVGGAIFTINGKYIDLSVAKKLEDTFENKTSEIISLLG